MLSHWIKQHAHMGCSPICACLLSHMCVAALPYVRACPPICAWLLSHMCVPAYVLASGQAIDSGHCCRCKCACTWWILLSPFVALIRTHSSIIIASDAVPVGCAWFMVARLRCSHSNRHLYANTSGCLAVYIVHMFHSDYFKLMKNTF